MTSPEKGDLAVWGQDVGRAGALGLVAYVEGVTGGEATLSDMGSEPEGSTPEQAPEGGIYYVRTVPVAQLASEGVQFVA